MSNFAFLEREWPAVHDAATPQIGVRSLVRSLVYMLHSFTARSRNAKTLRSATSI